MCKFNEQFRGGYTVLLFHHAQESLLHVCCPVPVKFIEMKSFDCLTPI